MFKTLRLSLFIVGLFSLFSCSTSKITVDSAKVKSLMASGEFRFIAEKANPTNSDVINVMNSFPGYTSSRFLSLDPGYGVNFTKTKLSFALPYFGRLYVANLDPQKNGFDFDTVDFTVDNSRSTVKKTVFLYNLKESQGIQQMYLEVYPNGRAYLSINSNDRQPISYDGYVADLPRSH